MFFNILWYPIYLIYMNRITSIYAFKISNWWFDFFFQHRPESVFSLVMERLSDVSSLDMWAYSRRYARILHYSWQPDVSRMVALQELRYGLLWMLTWKRTKTTCWCSTKSGVNCSGIWNPHTTKWGSTVRPCILSVFCPNQQVVYQGGTGYWVWGRPVQGLWLRRPVLWGSESGHLPESHRRLHWCTQISTQEVYWTERHTV